VNLLAFLNLLVNKLIAKADCNAAGPRARPLERTVFIRDRNEHKNLAADFPDRV
jgi:hypothetical protein